MVLREKDLQKDNLFLTEELSRSVAQCRKLTEALEIKNKRLYGRIDLLEKLMIENGIPVPDWADTVEAA